MNKKAPFFHTTTAANMGLCHIFAVVKKGGNGSIKFIFSANIYPYRFESATAQINSDQAITYLQQHLSLVSDSKLCTTYKVWFTGYKYHNKLLIFIPLNDNQLVYYFRLSLSLAITVCTTATSALPLLKGLIL
jgi:hypothetical protein